MLQVKKIGIDGVGPYKSRADLVVRPGITVIYGKNKLRDNNANFVGKSLLVRSIEELIYDPAIRQDKKVGSRFLSFVGNSGRQVELASSGSSIDVVVNGKSRTQRTKAENRRMVSRLWPLTAEDFSTYVYLDALASHPLVKGTSTARKNFFNSFFRLDVLDVEKKIFLKARLELKKLRAARTELERTYREISKDLMPSEKLEAEIERATTLDAKVRRLGKAFAKHQSDAALIAFKKIAGDRIHKKARPVDVVRKEIRDAKRAEEALEEYAQYRKELKRFKEATAGLDMDTPLEELKAAFEAYREAAYKASDEPEAPEDPGPRKKVNGDLGELRARMRQIEHQLTNAHQSKNGICHACGQAIKVKPSTLRAELEDLENKTDKLTLVAAHNARVDAYEAALAEYKRERAEWIKAKKKAKALKEKAELYEKRAHFREPEKVEKPQGLSGVSLADLEEELHQAVFLEEHADEIKRIKAGNLVETEFDHEELQRLQDKLASVKTRIAVHEGVVERAEAIRTRMRELDKKLAREEDLEIILQGYDDKAVKKMAIEAISTRLIEVVNRCARQVLPNYRFELKWETTSIDLIAHRPDGTTSDVRKLSGAESVLFTLVMVFALLVFVPDTKRVNTLILDEPTASFSGESTELFISLLGQLQTVIPSIIIVTPKKLRIPDARCYTVVQDARGSRIVKGHCDEV